MNAEERVRGLMGAGRHPGLRQGAELREGVPEGDPAHHLHRGDEPRGDQADHQGHLLRPERREEGVRRAGVAGACPLPAPVFTEAPRPAVPRRPGASVRPRSVGLALDSRALPSGPFCAREAPAAVPPRGLVPGCQSRVTRVTRSFDEDPRVPGQGTLPEVRRPHAARHPRALAQRGRGGRQGAGHPGRRREGPDPRGRPRQGRRREARQEPRRGQGARQADAGHEAQDASRPGPRARRSTRSTSRRAWPSARSCTSA